MVLDAVSNFVRGNTDAEVGTDDTTVSVADASIFPDPETDGEFNVVIWDVDNFPRPDQDGDVEIMRVTERDTTADELTVVREQETTSAAAHPEGSAIHLSPTAKMFSDIESTFGDFWDAGAQELTADVNNTNTTTTALEAEDIAVGRYETVEPGDLHDAVDDASAGDTLFLFGGESYREDEPLEIDTAITIIARTHPGTASSTLLDDIEINEETVQIHGGLAGDYIDINERRVVLQNVDSANVTVSDDECLITNCHNLDVTLESGTNGNLVANLVRGSSVTDNGDNTVGDIA